MDRGAWWATMHAITESDMTERLSLGLNIYKYINKLGYEGINFPISS